MGGPAGLADGAARSPGQEAFLPLRPGPGKEGRRPCRGPHPLAARRGPPPLPRALAVRAGDAAGRGSLRHADGIGGTPADGGAGTGGHHAGGGCAETRDPRAIPGWPPSGPCWAPGFPALKSGAPGTRRDAPRHQTLVGTLCPLVVGVRRRRPAAPRGGGEAARTRRCRRTTNHHRTPVHASPPPHTHTHAFANSFWGFIRGPRVGSVRRRPGPAVCFPPPTGRDLHASPGRPGQCRPAP